jgi:hypothetical protein
MIITLTKLTREKHRMDIARDDGSKESAELETRSLAAHDLLHYAVESAGMIEHGFYGLVAKGKTLAELNDREKMDMGSKHVADSDIGLTEIMVGPLSQLMNDKADESQALRAIEQVCGLQGVKVPPFMSIAWLSGVKKDINNLLRQWHSLRIGGTMQLHWPRKK